MTERERAPRKHIVDVLVAVGIDDARALAASDEQRCPADAAKCADRTAHTTRHHPLRIREEGRRALRRSCRQRSSRSHRATSFAKYVITTSAPARRMPTRLSNA